MMTKGSGRKAAGLECCQMKVSAKGKLTDVVVRKIAKVEFEVRVGST